MSNQATTFGTAAYGGPGWSPRTASHAEEIGTHWAACGIENEWAPLKAVLLHRPGPELAVEDFNAAQLLEQPNFARAVQQHDALATTYRTAGVTVHYVEPAVSPASPNQIFCADLFAMTPEGAILARPASTVRAGEERWVARRLADLGVPLLATLTGHAVFEGADLIWLDRRTAAIARGLRTNDEAIAQIGAILARLGTELIPFDLPFGTMHLMGLVRIFDRDLAVAWPRRTPFALVRALEARGTKVHFLPEEASASQNTAFNCVTLGPRKILMVAGHPVTQRFFEDLGVTVQAQPADELAKAAGAIGCLSGIVARAKDGA
jgi:N-dimethylarginine dimethylaminohydrolase